MEAAGRLPGHLQRPVVPFQPERRRPEEHPGPQPRSAGVVAGLSEPFPAQHPTLSRERPVGPALVPGALGHRLPGARQCAAGGWRPQHLRRDRAVRSHRRLEHLGRQLHPGNRPGVEARWEIRLDRGRLLPEPAQPPVRGGIWRHHPSAGADRSAGHRDQPADQPQLRQRLPRRAPVLFRLRPGHLPLHGPAAGDGRRAGERRLQP